MDQYDLFAWLVFHIVHIETDLNLSLTNPPSFHLAGQGCEGGALQSFLASDNSGMQTHYVDI